jgi:hypothetical protein
MATGVIKRKNLADRTGGNTDELSTCPVFGSSKQPIQFEDQLATWPATTTCLTDYPLIRSTSIILCEIMVLRLWLFF